MIGWARIKRWALALPTWAPSLSRTGTATVAVVGLVAAIVMGETNRLIEGALTQSGETGTMRALIGPLAAGETGIWTVWEDLGPLRMSVVWWVGVHTGADVVFYLAYVTVLARVFGWASPVARGLLAVLLAAEVVETVFLTLSAALLATGGVPVVLRAGVALAATAKWLAVLALAVTLLRDRTIRDWLPGRARLLWTAVKYQRSSAVPVALLGVLCTVPGPNILDQLPDVQRAWLGGPRGVRHGVFALVLTTLVAFLLLVLGRHRTRRAQQSRRNGVVPAEPAALWIWLAGPAVVGTLAVVLALWGPDGTVDLWHVLLFALVPLSVYVSSRVIRWRMARRPGRTLWAETATEPGYVNPPLADEVGRVGDGLALALFVVTGLGLVRAFTAPALLSGGEQRGARAALLAFGIALAVSAFPLGRAVVGRLPSFMRPMLAAGDDAGWVPWLARAIFVAIIGLLGALMVAADPIAGLLGATATVVLSVGTWVVLLGFLVVYLQDRQPPELFRLFRMRAVPILTLVVLVPAGATLLPDRDRLHHVRTLGPAQAPPARLDLAATFQHWLARSAACDRPVPGDTSVRVRPMVVAAASGGGIRAAFWTVSVLDEITKHGSCGQHATLLSSGVSGGSVGLTVARQSADPLAAVEALSESDALALGIGGTVAGDLFAGITGVRVPVFFGHRDHPARWADRAGLMEREWEQQVPGLTAPWDAEVRGPGGALLLNSTAVGFGCRVVVSQVDLRTGPPGEDTNCRTRSGLPAATLDLFTTYGACSPALSWATASMLSARFPFVTPAGRIPRDDGPCAERPDLQLVDGGYAESSGVGTLAEIAPELSALVREHNASGRGPFVVPLVVYFEDEHASDVTVAPPDDTPEVLVPLVGAAAKGLQGTSATLLQRVARAFAAPCPAAAPVACAAAVDSVLSGVPDGVVLVAPTTKPSVSAPLGWALSHDSRERMRVDLAEQRTECDVERGRYAALARLLQVLDPAGGHCEEVAP